ncbi:uncharacterized protein JCM15063_000744 [Sporobolomyces koalae]|uniref:uncharacterized protein n=1 Tax=Sporobolomyces koalae TaxID=500713 RepID=UPI00316EDE61
MSQQSRSSQQQLQSSQQQQQQQLQYQPTGAGTFPVLSVPDLIADLQQCECPATVEDLTHPTPARVQNIYEWWMNNSLGLNAEDVRRAAEAQLVQMDNPDIYREAMYMGVFRIAFSQLLIPCRITDFTIKDLTAPTANRFRQVLSAIINFHFFAQERDSEILQPWHEEQREAEEQEQALLDKTAALRAKIDQETARRQANAALIEEQSAAHEATVANFNRDKVEAGKLKQQGEEHKKAIAALHARKTELSQAISRYDMAISTLRGQIVSSPERLRSTIDDLNAQLARDQEVLKDTEARERQMNAKMSALAQYSTELESCIRLLNDWSADVNKLREAGQRLEKDTDEFKALQTERTELENQINLHRRRIVNAREEFSRISEKMDRKREAAKQRKKNLEEQHINALERKQKNDMEAAEKNREAGEVEAQIRAMHQSLHAELEKGEKAYKKIKDQVSLYSIRINKALDSINVVNSEPPQL